MSNATARPRRAAFLTAALASGMLLYAAALSTCRVATASPALVAAADVGAAPTPPPVVEPSRPAAPQIPDVTTNPLGFVDAVKTLWSTSWGIAVAVCVVGLLELLALAGEKFPKVAYLAWLGRGRISVAIGALTGVLSTAIAAFATGGWVAFLTSIGGGLLAFWHQAGTDPARS